MVNPNKYRRVAVAVLEKAPASAGGEVSSNSFFEAFLHLERLVRDYLRARDLYIPSRGASKMSFSFRQMVEALSVNEKIDREFYEELMEINKYRNLVFHGHVTQVNSEMVARTKSASEKMSGLP